MKKLLLLTMVGSAFWISNASAQALWCDCFGGWDEYGNYWYLQDFWGYPLENGDWVCAAWTGPDEQIDPPDMNGYSTDDDCLISQSFNYIEYGTFQLIATTWSEGFLDSLGQQRRPTEGDLIYCRIFDGPEGSINPGNYYGDSQTHEIQWVMGEEFYCLFPGDPGYGHTDTPIIPVSIELMSFVAQGRDGEILLEWKTASETNNFGFHIERSPDEVNFKRVSDAVIPGAGNSETENTYTYVDRNLVSGTTYYYNLISVDMDGIEVVVNEGPVAATPSAHVPKDFALGQNYPNPFNPSTQIKYQIPKDSHVTLKIHNVMGQEVKTLVESDEQAGNYTVTWDGRDAKGIEVSAGIYFCTLKAGEFSKTRKMVLLR